MSATPESDGAVARRGAAFHILAAAFAALSVLVWLRALNAAPWGGQFEPLAWHQHEMVFGVALAILAAFSLSAGRAWTGMEPVSRLQLGLLAAHWLAARVLVYSGPALLAALVDIAFPALLAAVLLRAAVRNAERHCAMLGALMALLALADAAFFLEQSGVLMVDRGTTALSAFYVLVLVVSVLGGRLLPALAARAAPGLVLRRSTALDAAALTLTLAAFASVVAGLPAGAVTPLAMGACAAHLVRQAGWAPSLALRFPLLGLLHLTYAWIAVGMGLLALESVRWAWNSASTHALGMGAVGGMLMALMTRTPLRAGAAELVILALVHIAALLRLVATFASPLAPEYLVLLDAAAIGWGGAFLAWLVLRAMASISAAPAAGVDAGQGIGAARDHSEGVPKRN